MNEDNKVIDSFDKSKENRLDVENISLKNITSILDYIAKIPKETWVCLAGITMCVPTTVAIVKIPKEQLVEIINRVINSIDKFKS